MEHRGHQEYGRARVPVFGMRVASTNGEEKQRPNISWRSLMKKQFQSFLHLGTLALLLSVGVSLNAQQSAPPTTPTDPAATPQAQPSDPAAQQPATPSQAQPSQTPDASGQGTPDSQAQA